MLMQVTTASEQLFPHCMEYATMVPQKQNAAVTGGDTL